MSCVLMIRSLRPVALTASVCARSSASPRRISTSEGGTTIPSVLATQTSDWPVKVDSPCSRSFGVTIRVSVAALAPTDPFIGASSTPSPNPDRREAAGVRANSVRPAPNSRSASGSRLSNTPISTKSGIACSRSLSRMLMIRLGSAARSCGDSTPVIMPATANKTVVPTSTM